ncbi:MAG TPA: hypothetical protein PLL10_08195, partial [Elusimicrobiales bacterium]|nr:hypothetical protein [Elusimicrobiales bacterium]
FEYVYPAYRTASGQLSSIYAHNWLLQFAAEYGVLCVVLWLIWAILRLSSLSKGYLWAVIAVFLHSLIDFTLSAPAIFFVFCWLLAAGDEEGRSVELSGRLNKAAALVYVFCVAVYLAFLLPKPWFLQKQLITARADSAAIGAGALPRLQKIRDSNPDDANAALLYASALADAGFAGTNHLESAAPAYERALRLNPFRPATYSELAAVYKAMGRQADVAQVLRWKADRFK